MLVLVTFVLIFLGGGLAHDVLGMIGLGDTVATASGAIARWPAALLCGDADLRDRLLRGAERRDPRASSFITPGAVFGVVAWILASAGFFFYVSNFSSYSATYGAFAGVVILLVWLWLTNVVLLLGAELNAVIDLRRSPAAVARSYDGPPLPEKVSADV